MRACYPSCCLEAYLSCSFLIALWSSLFFLLFLWRRLLLLLCCCVIWWLILSLVGSCSPVCVASNIHLERSELWALSLSHCHAWPLSDGLFRNLATPLSHSSVQQVRDFVTTADSDEWSCIVKARLPHIVLHEWVEAMIETEANNVWVARHDGVHERSNSATWPRLVHTLVGDVF